MRPLTVLNVVLLGLIGLSVWSVVDGWQSFEESVAVEPLDAEPEAVPAFAVPQAQAVPDVSVIGAANPFSVDRSSAVAVPLAASTPTGPRPYLFGTIRIGEDHMAMMAPSSATNRNEYRPYRLGQFVGGWELVEIDEKSVVVASGGGRQTITMNDPSARLPRARQANTLAPANTGGQVSTVGAAPKTPAVPATTAPPPAAPPPGAPVTVPYKTPFGIGQKVVR